MGGELPLLDGGTSLPQQPRPLLLAVAPDAAIARRLEAQLRRAFGERGFEATCTDSATAALSLIRSVREEGRAVALLIADNDLSEMSGLELIGQARELQPEARTVLLIGHARMPDALAAMNEGALDYFFVKPIAAEEQLIPVVSDLLGDWERWMEDAARAVRVVGERSEETHALCDFLARNEVHYRFLEEDCDDEARLLAAQGPRAPTLPLVVLADGTRLEAPSSLELARALGIATRPKDDRYDVVVVGGGPAGLAAAVYGASEGLRTLLVERDAPGGQAGQSSRIENYLGFPAGVRGGDLAQRALRQARRFQAEIVRPCEGLGLDADGGALRLEDDLMVGCRAAIVACGVSYRRLEAPGLEELVGRGVYYGAAVSDARDHQGRDVLVVGGANSAGQAALHFAGFARKVTIVARADSLAARMSRYLVDRIEAAANIEVLTATTIAAARGDEALEEVTLTDAHGTRRTVPAQALFIFIGAAPLTHWLPDAVARDSRGFVLTGRDLLISDASGSGWTLDRDPLPLETSVPGVFAAGDVRHGSVKRVASAVGEGAMAIQLVHEYLKEDEATIA